MTDTDTVKAEDEPVAIECAHWVEGSGEPVVFVHGIGSSHAGWSGVTAGLRASYRCITYDLRGHGISPLPDEPFNLDHLVADLEALRRTLGLDAWHIAGHSLGGMIGPAYCRKYPDRVKSLALISTAAGRTEEDSAKVNGVVKAMEQKGIAEVLGTLANRWYTDPFIESHPDLVQKRMDQVTGMDGEVFLNVFRIYAQTEMAPWLREIAAPSLVLTGEMDGGCNPRLNRFIQSELPNAELVILDGLKHAILAEAPDLVAAELQRFLQGIASKENSGNGGT